MNLNFISVWMVAILFAAPTAYAGDSEQDIKLRVGQGDPVAGKEKSVMCQGCHGEDGNSTSADYPKLAGQYAGYILKQVNDFKSGVREDPVMSAMAETVSEEQDLLDIAAYFASQNQMKGAQRVVNQAGATRFMDDTNGCVTCHGRNGKGYSPRQHRYPVIGGQHKDYLVKQLKNFKSRARKNDSGGVMVMVAGFMTEKDMEDVAAYISGL